VLGADGTNSNTQVPVVRCTWVHVVMSYHARHLMLLFLEDPAPAALLDIEKPTGMIVRARVHTEPGHTEDVHWTDR
jgi:hypothetical protein